MKTVVDKSNSTQRKVLNATRSIFELAVENDLIEKNPVTKSIKASGKRPEQVQPLSNEQIEALLAAVHGTRAYLFVLTLLMTGMRKGEAIGLLWKDIDLDAGTVHVQRSIVYPNGNRDGEINTSMKTPAANRVIPLDPSLHHALSDAKKKATSVYVFPMSNGKFMSEASFRKMWNIIKYRTKGTENIRDLTGRTLDFDVHPHQLRHTCITNWIRQGLGIKEAQYLAGHSTSDVTLDIYTHYQAELELAKTAQKVISARSELSVPV